MKRKERFRKFSKLQTRQDETKNIILIDLDSHETHNQFVEKSVNVASLAEKPTIKQYIFQENPYPINFDDVFGNSDRNFMDNELYFLPSFEREEEGSYFEDNMADAYIDTLIAEYMGNDEANFDIE